MSEAQKNILEFLRDAGSSTAAVIARWAAPNRTRGWTYHHTKDLVNEGLIFKHGNRYYISPDGLSRLWKEES